MKLNAQQKTFLIWGGIGLAVLAVGSWLVSKLTDFNKGTAFENTGAIGTLGNATNQVLGGVPAAVGTTLSETLFNLTHDDFDGTTYLFVFAESGGKGAVNSSDVDSRGFFNYWRDGQRYQLKKDQDGRKVAVRA